MASVNDYAGLKLSQEDYFKLMELRNRFHQLFYLELDGKGFVFRLLSVSEAKTVSSLSDTLPLHILQDWIAHSCVICGPKEALMDTLPAGYIKTISDSILELSSIVNEKDFVKVLEEERNRSNTLEKLIEYFICSAFRTISPTDVRNMTIPEQVEYLALAEQILGKTLELTTDKKKRRQGEQFQLRPGFSHAGPSSKERLLSREAADKPDFESDNRALRDV